MTTEAKDDAVDRTGQGDGLSGNPDGRATRLRLRDFRSRPMRAFHTTWVAFFLCFFGWFSIAPLMPLVRADLGLTNAQIGNTIIASVAITILARLVVGWICDRIGPRRTYAALLFIGALPVMGIGLAHDYQTFLLFRLLIGVVGASFVVTSYHTSLMFAPGCVGTASATAAGWGNLGGGAAHMLMPLLVAAIALTGAGAASWRIAMVVPGVLMIGAAFAYLAFTRDTPLGNFAELRRAGTMPPRKSSGSFWAAARDHRAWTLALCYAACFGVELTVNNVAAVYFRDTFNIGVTAAGLLAGLHGATNLFARALGGIAGDRAGRLWGLRGRAWLLATLLFCEGAALMIFSQTQLLVAAVPIFVLFSVCVAMSAGATYAVVPFINRDAIGSVSGIVGAGGNLGAVLIGLLFRSDGLPMRTALFYLGISVTLASLAVVALRFTRTDERRARFELATAASLVSPIDPA